MGILDFFKQVRTVTTEEVRIFLEGRAPETYNLVDVRQPKEYERGHLPGATLIPLGDLGSRVGELDPEKPTVTYCAAGVRSRSAASMLAGAGFKDVASMAGGIRAWKGLVAEGPPEAGMASFTAASSPDEIRALAWALEEGSRRFYLGIAENIDDDEAVRLFRSLGAAEEHHKQSLLDLPPAARESEVETTASALLGTPPGTIMEGGIRVQEALQWTAGKGLAEILELAMSLEANAYDLYVKMARRLDDKASRRVLATLVEEEQAHLERLSELFEANS